MPDEAVMRLFAVYADALRRLSKAEADLYEANIEERLRTTGMSERELIEFGTEFGNRVSAALERALIMVYRQHRVHVWTEHSVNHVEAALDAEGVESYEPQPPAICFVDLTGYTRLTEERGDRFAADVAAQLASLVKDISRRRGGNRSDGSATEGCSTFATPALRWRRDWTWWSRLLRSGCRRRTSGYTRGRSSFRMATCTGRPSTSPRDLHP